MTATDRLLSPVTPCKENVGPLFWPVTKECNKASAEPMCSLCSVNRCQELLNECCELSEHVNSNPMQYDEMIVLLQVTTAGTLLGCRPTPRHSHATARLRSSTRAGHFWEPSALSPPSSWCAYPFPPHCLSASPMLGSASVRGMHVHARKSVLGVCCSNFANLYDCK